MDLPARWRDYPCADYFSSPFAETGLWDRGAEFWIIEPAQKVEEEAEIEFLQVGRPGVDSIGFGYRKGQPGFWAYDPMEQEFQYLASSLEEFLVGWYSGAISL